MPSPPNANSFYFISKGGRGKKKLGDIFASEEYSCCSFYILFNLKKKKIKKRPYNRERMKPYIYRPNFKNVSIQVQQWLGTKYTPKKIENLKNNSCNQYKQLQDFEAK